MRLKFEPPRLMGYVRFTGRMAAWCSEILPASGISAFGSDFSGTTTHPVLERDPVA
jgi:hypothetical protein